MNYTALRELGEDEKLAPQAKTIMETIIAKVGLNTPIEKADLVAELEDGNKLNTRQPVARVIGYYTPKLIEADLVKTAKPPKEEKPAKAKKEAAPTKAETAA